ncbi:MAG: hypothetical protein J6B06_04355 [Lachnospiraceae bacterium]|nr:hypothetical protein [Lachnospiraceae bacterium]
MGEYIKVMSNSFSIYCTGGDEFAIIYFNKSLETVKRETALALKECAELHLDDSIPVGATIHRADISMYSQKEKFYKEKGLETRKG